VGVGPFGMSQGVVQGFPTFGAQGMGFMGPLPAVGGLGGNAVQVAGEQGVDAQQAVSSVGAEDQIAASAGQDPPSVSALQQPSASRDSVEAASATTQHQPESSASAAGQVSETTAPSQPSRVSQTQTDTPQASSEPAQAAQTQQLPPSQQPPPPLPWSQNASWSFNDQAQEQVEAKPASSRTGAASQPTATTSSVDATERPSDSPLPATHPRSLGGTGSATSESANGSAATATSRQGNENADEEVGERRRADKGKGRAVEVEDVPDADQS